MTTGNQSHLGEAFARHQAGDLVSALRGYRRAIGEAPSDTNGWHLIGCGLEQAGDPERAARSLFRAAALDPANPTVRGNLGLVLMSGGRNAAAEAAFLSALEADATHRPALVGLANLRGRTGRPEEAKRTLRGLLVLDPAFAGGFVYMAELALGSWALAEVAICALRARAAHPDGLAGAPLVVLPFASLSAGQIAGLDRGNVVRRLLDAGLGQRTDDPFGPWSVATVASMFQFAGWPDDVRSEADRQTLFRRAAEGFAGRCESRPPPSHQSPAGKRMTFVVGKLGDMRHAPTRFVLNWAKWAADGIPGLSVLVAVVHDADAAKYRTMHQEAVAGSKVEFWYTDMRRAPIERDCVALSAIQAFDPTTVFCWADELPFEEEIFRRFPTIQFSQMLRYPLPSADVVATLFDASKARTRWAVQGLRDVEGAEVYRLSAVPADLPVAASRRSRAEFGLSPDEFVIVSVSNRLQLEMKPAFVGMMFAHLAENPSSMWLCVGASSFGNSEYDDHPLAKRCLFVSYDKDLPGLYGLCDAYANLPQRGGGLSLLWAMTSGRPALTLDEAADGAGYVPDADRMAGLDAYGATLARLARDPIYRREFGRRMADAAARLTAPANVVRDLEALMNLASKAFHRRRAHSA